MPDQIFIGKFPKGQNDYYTAFNIDNGSFTFLFNMYVWRGQVKRKRGTVFLGRLTRQLINITLGATTPGQTTLTINIFSNLGINPSQPGASIVPGSVGIGVSAPDTSAFADNGNGTFSVSGLGLSGTINYASGQIILNWSSPLTGGATILLTTFNYYPGLPVMGLRDFTSSTSFANYPLLIAFDTKYAYQCNQMDLNASFFSVSYYKSTGNPVTWSGQDYQLFWSTNYPSTTTNQSGAFWATNNVPGFHFNPLVNVGGFSITRVSATQVTIRITSSNLIPNDIIWINEVTGTIATGSGVTQNQNINGQTGYVVSVTPGAPDTVTVNFDGTKGSSLANFQPGATGSGGIAQYLTSSTAGTGDGIRWYDGDMTGGTGIPVTTATGWVNFSPPLSATTVSINGLPPALYYLVGALAIVPFKDRLLFFSPYIQAAGGSPIQLQDTVIWSWNGTPFYSALVPNNQTFAINAYYVDQTGLGGYLSAGISRPIQTITNNEDVLLVGFGGNGRKTRFAYTGNDFQPFLFYNINSELPSTSTFSSVVLDKGAIDIGSFGICITDQQSAQRIDLDIPNSVFQIQKNNNGALRVNAIRDYINEWIYFCYPVDNSSWRFPIQTFLFNYRDNTWAVLYENFTCHGNYRANDTITWATLPYLSWQEWIDPWNTGTETDYEIQVIAGNPQGYVLIKGVGTGEGVSGYISGLSNDGHGNTQITSYNHCLTDSNPNTFDTDFIYIEGCIGTNASTINNNVYQVIRIIDENNFVVDFLYNGTDYMGGGQFRRLSQPVMQTKQFPFYWEQGRQVRIGVQRYLLDTTENGQVTLNIYLSQDPDDPWNNPSFAGIPNGLEYSQTLFTCLEGTDPLVNPYNVNLQTQVGRAQQQIWHRMNTSLMGDTFQIGITLSTDQMKDIDLATDEIVLHGMHFNVSPGPLLA